MQSSVNYIIRSLQDGKYLVARIQVSEDLPESSYLLLFKENYDALSYINVHARDLRDRLTVESISGNQLKGLMQRWGYRGIGLVKDPLVPEIEFLTQE
jgi:hypothetical protein